MFRFIRFSENIGSGFHKMINGWNSKYNLKPIIESDFDYYKITFPTITNTITNTITKGDAIDKRYIKLRLNQLLKRAKKPKR